MYSPRIREDLVRQIYRTAKEKHVAMTTWVNRAIEAALAVKEEGGQATRGIGAGVSTDPSNASSRGGLSP
jgi:hypothetical protein